MKPWSFFGREPVFPIVGVNPDHYLTPYSTYNTTEEGLKIEALFRKVGTHEWYPAFSTAIEKVVLLDIKKDEPAPVRIQ